MTGLQSENYLSAHWALVWITVALGGRHGGARDLHGEVVGRD
jgi:hypothetical protein